MLTESIPVWLAIPGGILGWLAGAWLLSLMLRDWLR